MVYGEKEHELILAASGDSIWTRRISVYNEERFLSLIKVLRDADVTFTNLETPVHDYKGYPVSYTEGPTALMAEPYIIEEYKWAGFNIVSRANNHCLDWGIEGALATSEVLDRASLVHAGFGRNLGEARAPAYLETKNGRVALISIDTSLTNVTANGNFTPREIAGAAGPELPGRPGTNPLRWETNYVVDSSTLEQLKNVGSSFAGLGKEWAIRNAPTWDVFQKSNWYPESSEAEKGSYVLERRFVEGEKYDLRSRVLKLDYDGNLKSVRDARKQADWVLVTLHHHGFTKSNGHLFPEFLELFARGCIDAGADAFIGHGPHHLQGIELYKDKPIFYSLGNFVFQLNMKKLPADAYEEVGLGGDVTPREFWNKWISALYAESVGPVYLVSVVPVCDFKEGKLSELKLYPIELGYGKPHPWFQSGRPMLTNKEQGQKVIDMMRELSAPYGTKIEFEGEIGVIKPE